MGLGIDPEILAKANEALDRFAEKDQTFYRIKENVTALQNQLKKMGIPYTEWVSENVFAAAAFQCRAEGTLIERPPAKSQEQLNREREMRDREAGSLAGNKNTDELTATGKFIKTLQNAKQRIADEAKEEADRQAKERDIEERPWLYAPDFRVELSTKEQYALPRPVYRWWLTKRNNWLRTQAQAAEEAKRNAKETGENQ